MFQKHRLPQCAGAWRLALLCAAAVLLVQPVSADPVTFVRVQSGVDWTSAGVCGVGATGSGTITLAGISGSVNLALLYWHGIDSSGPGAVYDNATVTINGSSVTGTAIGDATTNCWGAGSSTAYVADVTAHVAGNGAYLIEGLSNGAGHSGNGASLVVTFDDGDANNNRDLAYFEGNDSNFTESFPGETDGWHGTLTPIAYDGVSPVAAQLHVADGQNAPDNSLDFTTASGATTVLDSAVLYDGVSLPDEGGGRNGHGLYDIHTFDITAAFGGVADATATLDIDGQDPTNDCLGLILVLIDLEAGAAPPDPRCGDGNLDPGEQCDDGNLDDGDGCSSTCQIETDGACCTNGPGTETECIITTRTDCETNHSLFLGEGTVCTGDIDCFALLVEFEWMSATAVEDGVMIRWTTSTEIDTVGFRVLRESFSGGRKAIDQVGNMIPAQGSNLTGATYELLDDAPEAATAGSYFIEDVDIYGRVTRHGPIMVDRGSRIRNDRTTGNRTGR